MNDGWIKIHRKLVDNDIFYKKPDKWLKIWLYILLSVNHQDTKELKRGTGFFKYEWIQEKVRCTRNELDHCIRYLKSATQIATQKATRGFVIKVLNYEAYQQPGSDEKRQEKREQKRFKSDTKATLLNKNDKNANKEKNILSKDNTVPVKKEYGDKRINDLLRFLKKELNLADFMESQKKQRIYAKHILNLVDKIGKEKFNGIWRDFKNTDYFPNIKKIETIYRNIKTLPTTYEKRSTILA